MKTTVLALPCALACLAGGALAADLEESARAVAALYRQGRAEAAAQLVARDPRLVASDEAPDQVRVSAVFRSRREGLELVVRRAPGAGGALAVVFPPGTFAAVDPASRREYGRLSQDLMLLRAPVVVLEADAAEASVVVPVACGTYRRQGPEPGRPYRLDREPAGSATARLLARLCAGDAPPPEREAALALWVVREDLAWSYLSGRAFHSFQTRRPVTVAQAPGAAALVAEAGLAPDAFGFFADGGVAPKSTAADEPAARREPAEPADPPARP